MVKRQYSGNARGIVKGIGIVNLVYAFGDDYHPIDYRVYAPDADGKTKNDHFREMLRLAFEENAFKRKPSCSTTGTPHQKILNTFIGL